jgi:hypothetical protein
MTRGFWRLQVLLRAAAALLAVAAAPGAALGEPDCLGPAAPLQTVSSNVAALAVSVPAEWKVALEEHRDGLIVRDRERGCRLEVALEPAMLTVEETARLRERIYTGPSTLAPACREQVLEELGLDDVAVGEYAAREFGPRTLAMYREFEDRLLTATLRCPQCKGTAVGWRTAIAIFTSLQRPAGEHKDVPEVAARLPLLEDGLEAAPHAILFLLLHAGGLLHPVQDRNRLVAGRVELVQPLVPDA